MDQYKKDNKEKYSNLYKVMTKQYAWQEPIHIPGFVAISKYGMKY